jgi:hypothetical protein
MEERIAELEAKLGKVYEWAKKVTARLEALEEPKQSNLTAAAWSKDEEKHLMQEVKGLNPIRPRLIELEQEWPGLFDRERSAGALRKKYNRLKDKSEYR